MHGATIKKATKVLDFFIVLII